MARSRALTVVRAPLALPLDRNPALVFLGRMTTEKSRGAMAGALKLLVRTAGAKETDPVAFPWHEMRYQHATRLRAKLVEEGYAPGTVNHALAALKGVVREAWRLRLMPSDAMHRICERGGLPPVKSQVLPKGRYVEPTEVEALFRNVGVGLAGARNAALLAVMFGCGLRRAEVALLEVKDYHPEAVEVHVRGKGHKERLVPCPSARKAIEKWLLKRPMQQAVRQLFLSERGEALSERSIPDVLNEVARRAEVDHLTPHDTRRTYISNVIDETGDVAIACKLAGHSSIVTTMRYDRRPERAKREAAEKVQIPYVEKDE